MRALLVALVLLAAAPATAVATLRVFRTPSGAVGCAYYRDPSSAPSVRCDVRGGGDHAWTVRATGRARRTRATDTVLDPRAPVLAYGHTRRFGRIACTSRPTGLTCRNADGHGFTLARERQRIF